MYVSSLVVVNDIYIRCCHAVLCLPVAIFYPLGGPLVVVGLPERIAARLQQLIVAVMGHGFVLCRVSPVCECFRMYLFFQICFSIKYM